MPARWFPILMLTVALGIAALVPAAFAQRSGLDDAAIAAERKRFEVESGIKAPCAMPRPSDGARVVLFLGAAEALSTATAGSQDVATRTGAIVVDAGRDPLYLVVTSFHPTIWRITGATGRIERLVLAGMSTGPNEAIPGKLPLIGATGIARERVTFLRHPHCLHLFESPANWIEAADRLLKFEIGRGNVRRGVFGEVSEVSVPSFTHRSLRLQPMPMVVFGRSNSVLVIEGRTSSQLILSGRNDLDEELKLFMPGGVTQVDAGAVVASLPAEPYEVLPQQAGLIQLMQSGALTRDDQGDFIIGRKIRLPAELNGGHKFRLPRGVPEPDGHSGHSCVWVEETGAARPGSHC